MCLPPRNYFPPVPSSPGEGQDGCRGGLQHSARIPGKRKGERCGAHPSCRPPFKERETTDFLRHPPTVFRFSLAGENWVT